MSAAKCFDGVQSSKLHQLIYQLESVLPYFKMQDDDYESIEQHVQEKYHSNIQDIANFLTDNNTKKYPYAALYRRNNWLDSKQLQRIYKEFKKRKSGGSISKVFEQQKSSQLERVYENTGQYVEDEGQIVSVGKQLEKEEIVRQYESELEDLKKEIVQKEMGIDEDDSKCCLLLCLDVIEQKNTQLSQEEVQSNQDKLQQIVVMLTGILTKHNKGVDLGIE